MRREWVSTGGSFSDEQRRGLVKAGAHTARRAKDDKNDFASWSLQADEAGYRYATVLHQVQSDQQPLSDQPVDEFSKQLLAAITEALRYTDPQDQADRLIWEVDQVIYEHAASGALTSRLAGSLMSAIKASLEPGADAGAVLIDRTGEAIRQHAERAQARQDQLTAAYEAALPQLEDEYRRRAVLDANEVRTVAARAFAATGGINDAGPDLDATMAAFRRDGVIHEGQRVRLVEQETVNVRGKEHVRVTTALHVSQEQELIRLARVAAADRSSALPGEKINLTGLSEEQRRMVAQLGTGGRLSVVIGVPGSGKTFALHSLTQAWHVDGRNVYGISLAWRQAGDLKAAGIQQRSSIAAFLRRVETGRYKLNPESVIVVDEVGLVGSRQMLELLRVRERTGAQLVLIGDPRQNQPIEGASGLELLRAALGDTAISRLLKSVRQDSDREREIAALFRRGAAAEALQMKQEDGTAILVAGGREATIRRVARLWVERHNANREDPAFRLSVSAPTNADAREIGVAIRTELQKAGHIGPDVKIIQAIDRIGDTSEMKLAVGDRVRVFDRVYDPVDRRRALASNGDVVEVMQIREDGMRVRNSTTGAVGLIAWDKLRSREDGPLRLAPGYALTVDTAQGSTATEHIHALPSGSRETHGFKTYVAATRHRKANWLVIDEASERREISERAMLGHQLEITEELVWKNVAKNVSRQPLKPSALSVVQERRHQPRQRAA
jgi:hypothetical protein